MTLPSSEIWTLGSNASAFQTRCQRAIYALLSRARYAREDIESLYGSLAGIAAQAHALRDIGAIEIASEIMLGLPVSTRAKNIARYYQAFCTSADEGSLESQGWWFSASEASPKRKEGRRLEHPVPARSPALVVYQRCCFDLQLISRLLPDRRCRCHHRKNMIGRPLWNGRQEPASRMDQDS